MINYRIVSGTDCISIDDVADLLKQTYWAGQRTKERIRRSMENSDCYGIYVEGSDKLAGFARVITDHATTYYLCDVIVDEKYRRQGLGTALISYIEALPDYKELRGLLMTANAHGLYEKFGFRRVSDRAMQKTNE